MYTFNFRDVGLFVCLLGTRSCYVMVWCAMSGQESLVFWASGLLLEYASLFCSVLACLLAFAGI